MTIKLVRLFGIEIGWRPNIRDWGMERWDWRESVIGPGLRGTDVKRVPLSGAGFAIGPLEVGRCPSPPNDRSKLLDR